MNNIFPNQWQEKELPWILVRLSWAISWLAWSNKNKAIETLESPDNCKSFVTTLLKKELYFLVNYELIDQERFEQDLSAIVEWLFDTEEIQINSEKEKYISFFLFKISKNLIWDDELLRFLEKIWLRVDKIDLKREKNIENRLIKNIEEIVKLLSKTLLWKEPTSEKDILDATYQLITSDFEDKIIPPQLFLDILLFYSISRWKKQRTDKIKTPNWDLNVEEAERKASKWREWQQRVYWKKIEEQNNSRLRYLSFLYIIKLWNKLREDLGNYLINFKIEILNHKYWVEVSNKEANNFFNFWIYDAISDLTGDKEKAIAKIIFKAPTLFLKKDIEQDELFKYLLWDLRDDQYNKILEFLGEERSKKWTHRQLIEIFKGENWNYWELKDEEQANKATWETVKKQLQQTKPVENSTKIRPNHKKRRTQKRENKVVESIKIADTSWKREVKEIEAKNKYDEYLKRLLEEWDIDKINQFREKAENFLKYILNNINQWRTTSTNNNTDIGSWNLTWILKSRYFNRIYQKLDEIFENGWVVTFTDFNPDKVGSRQGDKESLFIRCIDPFEDMYLFESIFSYKQIVDFIWGNVNAEFKLVKEHFDSIINKWLKTYFREI